MSSSHEKPMVAFLAGDLELEAARTFDAHLLSCESCWAAVRADRAARRLLEASREPTPTGLADRVRLAIEVEARQQTHRKRHIRSGGVAAVIASGLAALLALTVGSKGGAPGDAPAVAAVLASAEHLPAGADIPAIPSSPTPAGSPEGVTASGQKVVLHHYRFGSEEAVVATSAEPFPMPAGAQPLAGSTGMAWTASISGVSMLCLNGSSSVLLAGRVPMDHLRALAAELHLH